ncbi:DUF5671 domain-containing protein [Futiania mangrovi]|uniref:DUF5671 domain-containing protein n=1 Tax=Futiania mangrovi TaxID=2959716 RepID=A0A9J6PD51_9PROT|nr:DUF5671 domain-containing protein [Futiania mangrovii]MCP1335744.1 DUF5671 domain-containing protein [Futiania mangrovii]
MSVTQSELALFVRDALTRGVRREEIAAALDKAGWRREQVRDALAAYAEVDFVVPVPRPRPYVSARDAFLYLVLFSTLGLSAWHLGILLFNLIDLLIPDPAQPWGEYRAMGIRWSVSVLVVAFPLYLYLARKTSREVAEDPARRASRVRKWLTYVTLFVAALAILGDVVALIYQFLSGDLTVPLLLKILVVALIAVPIFLFYLRDVSSDEGEG